MAEHRPVDFWRGDFGSEYIGRNTADAAAVRQRTRSWGCYLQNILPDLPRSILEVGCSIGINLRALNNLVDADLHGLEPNDAARRVLAEEGVLPKSHIHEGEAKSLPFKDGQFEMTFTTGVLIHVPPSELPAAMDELYRVSSKYILMSEYFAHEPEEKTYRGQHGLLFKRDFGGFMLDRHPDLTIVDYGFQWMRAGAADNGHWWLFRK